MPSTNESPRPAPLPPLDLLQRYSLDEASRYLRQSRAKTFQDIRDGRLEVLKDGRRTYVSGEVIAAKSRSGDPEARH